jgi:hypothetical protein
MFKVHSLRPKTIESYRSDFINLAISLYQIPEPAPCSTMKYSVNDIEYTL